MIEPGQKKPIIGNSLLFALFDIINVILLLLVLGTRLPWQVRCCKNVTGQSVLPLCLCSDCFLGSRPSRRAGAHERMKIGNKHYFYTRTLCRA